LFNSKLKKMVHVVGYKERFSSEGKSFMALILQGGVEIIESANGKLYATARKASVASTFDEETCKILIGQELPGTIEKVECEPYEYTNPNTGEILYLTHRYTFAPDNKDGVNHTVENFIEIPVAESQVM
jgi:hypothetical protein